MRLYPLYLKIYQNARSLSFKIKKAALWYKSPHITLFIDAYWYVIMQKKKSKWREKDPNGSGGWIVWKRNRIHE